MLEALSFTLRHGLEIALVLTALTVFLNENAARMQMKFFFLALILSIPLAYNFNLVGGREIWSGVLGLLISGGIIFLVIFKRHALISGWIGCIVTWGLVLLKGTDIALFPRYTFLQAVSMINTELLLTAAGLFIGVFVSVMIFFMLRSAWSNLKLPHLWAAAGGTLFFTALSQLVTGLQVLVVYGIIPMYAWLVKMLIPLINGQEKIFYTNVIFNAFVLGIALYLRHKTVVSAEGNPAQIRKRQSVKLKSIRILRTSLASMLLVLLVLGINTVYANRTVKLSEAVPIKADAGELSISAEVLADNKLHRFSYTSSGGTELRFIAIHKGSGVYGVGLDACDICGTAGYYQRKEDVICVNCDVVISIPTIGFPGGCNPIPLKSSAEDDRLVIPVEELERKVEVFAE